MAPRELIIDGNNLVMRAIKVAQGKQVHLAAEVDGEEVPTAALTIFVRMLTAIVREQAPRGLIVCWDGGRSQRRVAMYPDYKAHRVQPFEDGEEEQSKRTTFDLAQTFLGLSGVATVRVPGFEADDLVSYYWARRGQGCTVIIVSADKDFLQLADEETFLLRPGEDGLYGVEEIRARYNCHPRDLASVMALMGDPGDNIPGVKGVGVKRAVAMLREADWDLHRLLDDPPRLLQGQKDLVLRNLSLIELRTNEALLPLTSDEPDQIPRFDPTDVDALAYEALVWFLDRYRLHDALNRLESGTLWRS